VALNHSPRRPFGSDLHLEGGPQRAKPHVRDFLMAASVARRQPFRNLCGQSFKPDNCRCLCGFTIQNRNLPRINESAHQVAPKDRRVYRK